jgi:hypothetical protein
MTTAAQEFDWTDPNGSIERAVARAIGNDPVRAIEGARRELYQIANDDPQLRGHEAQVADIILRNREYMNELRPLANEAQAKNDDSRLRTRVRELALPEIRASASAGSENGQPAPWSITAEHRERRAARQEEQKKFDRDRLTADERPRRTLTRIDQLDDMVSEQTARRKERATQLQSEGLNYQTAEGADWTVGDVIHARRVARQRARG